MWRNAATTRTRSFVTINIRRNYNLTPQRGGPWARTYRVGDDHPRPNRQKKMGLVNDKSVLVIKCKVSFNELNNVIAYEERFSFSLTSNDVVCGNACLVVFELFMNTCDFPYQWYVDFKRTLGLFI